MPRLTPVCSLGEPWLIGETVAIGRLPRSGTPACEMDSRRRARDAAGHPAGVRHFAGLALGVLPTVILEERGGSWSPLVTRSNWITGILLQLLLLAALPGLAAVQEFAVRGGGTPVPFDPPKRLVTTGPYAYVRNPMQLSGALVMLGWGAILGSWWVAGAGLMAVVYGAGFAAETRAATSIADSGRRGARTRPQFGRGSPGGRRSIATTFATTRVRWSRGRGPRSSQRSTWPSSAARALSFGRGSRRVAPSGSRSSRRSTTH